MIHTCVYTQFAQYMYVQHHSKLISISLVHAIEIFGSVPDATCTFEIIVRGSCRYALLPCAYCRQQHVPSKIGNMYRRAIICIARMCTFVHIITDDNTYRHTRFQLKNLNFWLFGFFVPDTRFGGGIGIEPSLCS